MVRPVVVGIVLPKGDNAVVEAFALPKDGRLLSSLSGGRGVPYAFLSLLPFDEVLSLVLRRAMRIRMTATCRAD